MLIQFYAYWQTTQFFLVNAKRRIEDTRQKLLEQPTEFETIPELGGDLAALLDEVTETKIRSMGLLDRLRNLL